jgi:hypothetical protein
VIPDFSGKPGIMVLFVYVAVAQKRGIAKVGQIIPYASRTGRAPEASYAGYAMYAGHKHFPKPDQFED